MLISRVFYWSVLLCCVVSGVRSKLFTLRSTRSKACLLLDIDFRITVTARSASSRGDFIVGTKTYTADESTNTYGQCWGKTKEIRLAFSESPLQNFLFTFHTTDDSVMLSRRFSFLPEALFPQLQGLAGFLEFEDPHVLNLGGIGTSYQCSVLESASYVKINGYERDYTYSVHVDIVSMHTQAFSVEKSGFSNATWCESPAPHRDGHRDTDTDRDPGDRPRPDTVQVIVGACAAGLLLVGVVVSLSLAVLCRTYREKNIRWHNMQNTFVS